MDTVMVRQNLIPVQVSGYRAYRPLANFMIARSSEEADPIGRMGIFDTA
jgi:hypothetical protein